MAVGPKLIQEYQSLADTIMNDEADKKRNEQHRQCTQWKGNILKTNNLLNFMQHHLKRVGCEMKNKDFVCEPCPQPSSGHFSLEKGIVICENYLTSEEQVAETMVHESIHAFDHCRAKVDWHNCRHHACSEIRAAALSGDCNWYNEFRRGNVGLNIKNRYQDCVKRRAILSLTMNESCGGKPEEVVEQVFEKCFKDTEPFDEIY